MAKSTQDAPSTRQRRRMTLVDVAREVGLSTSTVSLVMRDSATIPERTRRRVHEAADRLGYVYNRRAAGLRSSESGIVGVVVNDLTNPYFAEIVAAIQDAMAVKGKVVVLSNTAESLERQREFVETMREYNVDGIVLCPAADTPPELIRHIQSWYMPCILFSRNVSGVEADYVGADNRLAVKLATRHLIELGHRRIAMIGINPHISTGRERGDGYLAALEEASIAMNEELMVACPATREAGMKAITHLLDMPQPPTAAVCFNDILAYGVMLGLRACRLEPGRDFSVAGCDDIAESALWRPALTSVALSRKALGEKIVEMLSNRLENTSSPPESQFVEPELVTRDTTLPPRNLIELAAPPT